MRTFTSSLPKSEYRRKAQLDDAGRSVVRNIEEGYKRSNTSAYIEFISFSQGSLEEVKGDIRELTEDGFLPSKPGLSLQGIGINLKDLNTALKPKGQLKDTKGDIKEKVMPGKKAPPDSDSLFLYRPLTLLYSPLSKIKARDLTYEIFIELINKTDYLLRVLVQSLEKKLQEDKKAYLLDQERIKEKFRRK
ncbi:MAG: four helix bundle protein [Candidatus Levybacteria bacterium]|nr:four helix bundle protein [Candidatus Levybacteria bacterium]